MNLVPVQKSQAELAGHFDRIGRNAQRPNFVDRFQVGVCVRMKPSACLYPVFTGAGYADTDGPAFKAWYCVPCATELLAAQGASA